MSTKDNITESTNSSIDSTEWPYPIPLMPETPSDIDYPIDAMPSFLRDIIQTYHSYGRQPLPLIACSALANISLACQSMANVARDNYLKSPVSLYFLMVANSGERKSAVDTLFSNKARQWEELFRSDREYEVQAMTTLHNAWKMERDGLLSQIRRNTSTGEDSSELKAQLIILMADEPKIPITPTLYFEDTTGNCQ